jgi:hypothetical protein
MSEYTEVERPFLQQLAELGWTVIDQGTGVPQDAAPSLRGNFRQCSVDAGGRMVSRRPCYVARFSTCVNI